MSEFIDVRITREDRRYAGNYENPKFCLLATALTRIFPDKLANVGTEDFSLIEQSTRYKETRYSFNYNFRIFFSYYIPKFLFIPFTVRAKRIK